MVMPLERLPDWRARLARYIAEEERTRFAWGSSDCVLFAAGAVVAVTGVDPAESWRGTYTDEAGARAVLAELGCGDVFCVADQYLTRRPRPRPGDVVGINEGDLGSLAVCVGPAVRVRMLRGLGTVPLTDPRIVATWGVG